MKKETEVSGPPKAIHGLRLQSEGQAVMRRIEAERQQVKAKLGTTGWVDDWWLAKAEEGGTRGKGAERKENATEVERRIEDVHREGNDGDDQNMQEVEGGMASLGLYPPVPLSPERPTGEQGQMMEPEPFEN